jgi:hypothetical protein
LVNGEDVTGSWTGNLSAVGNLDNGNDLLVGYTTVGDVATKYICPRLYKGVAWSEADVQADYLKGASAVQFMTGFGYPISVADEGGVVGQQIGGFASPFRAGDTTGRWRVETDKVNGKLCKVLVCKTAGIVYVPTTYFFDATPNEAAHGTWDWWMSHSGSSNTDVLLVASVPLGPTDAGQDGYYFQINSSERVVGYENVAGVPSVKFYTDQNAVVADTWTRFRVTRTGGAVFTTYINGVVAVAVSGTNPFTDTTTTTSSYIVFDLDAGDKICLGNAQGSGSYGILKMLGVVAP